MRSRAIHNEVSSAMVFDCSGRNNGCCDATDDFKKSLHFLAHSTGASRAWRRNA
jgi:hypothetical protein